MKRSKTGGLPYQSSPFSQLQDTYFHNHFFHCEYFSEVDIPMQTLTWLTASAPCSIPLILIITFSRARTAPLSVFPGFTKQNLITFSSLYPQILTLWGRLMSSLSWGWWPYRYHFHLNSNESCKSCDCPVTNKNLRKQHLPFKEGRMTPIITPIVMNPIFSLSEPYITSSVHDHELLRFDFDRDGLWNMIIKM